MKVVVTNVKYDNDEIEFIITRDSQVERVRRTLSSFTNWAESHLSFPPLPSSFHEAAVIAYCTELNEFLIQVQNTDDFVSYFSIDSETTAAPTMSAIQFVLQPFEYEKVHIARGSKYERELVVTEAQSVVVWKFEVVEYDIDFEVNFYPEENKEAVTHVHHKTRYESNSTVIKPVEGMFKCLQKGTISFSWDNSYSLVRGKNIMLLAEVVPEETMESATEASDAFADAVQNHQADLLGNCIDTTVAPPAVDSADGAYISQLADYGNNIVAGTGAWLANTAASTRLFGSETSSGDTDKTSTSAVVNNTAVDTEKIHLDKIRSLETTVKEQASVIRELNELKSEILKRNDKLEDDLAKAGVAQKQISLSLKTVTDEVDTARSQLFESEAEVIFLKQESSRHAKEREAWAELQQERDALLIEKQRWENDNIDQENLEGPLSQSEDAVILSDEERAALERALCEAEGSVLRLRAELGYKSSSVGAHLIIGDNTNTRLEALASDLIERKLKYERESEQHGVEKNEWKEELSNLKGQKRVLVNELRTLRKATENQVAVAMAEANETRMVCKRLKKQNELLLAQLRNVMESEEVQRKHPCSNSTSKTSDSPVAYNVEESALAMLNGNKKTTTSSSHRERLVQFFNEYDPSQLSQVDSMLESYRGVEEALFQSLELKYLYDKISEN